jgi:hypothetical protein
MFGHIITMLTMYKHEIVLKIGRVQSGLVLVCFKFEAAASSSRSMRLWKQTEPGKRRFSGKA